ncbi:MAG TPA: hypothetical protein DCX42_01240, partial [Planktomarina temperata]|nr:hypothetical protein [Planktomarina temperata]
GRRIHHVGMLERMVIAQSLQSFHHQTHAPAQAGAALISYCKGVIQRSWQRPAPMGAGLKIR